MKLKCYNVDAPNRAARSTNTPKIKVYETALEAGVCIGNYMYSGLSSGLHV